MAKCNNTVYAILGMLSTKGPLSGYDINKIFDITSNWYWSENNAQLYPMLKKLDQSGCVTSEICEDSGARQRRIYTITDQGIEKLKQWLLEPIEPRPKREELLLKLRFTHMSAPDEMLKHVDQFRRETLDMINQFDSIKCMIDTRHKDGPDYDYVMMTFDYAKELLQAKLQWAERTIKQLQKKNKKVKQ